MIDLGPLRCFSPERWEALCRSLQPEDKKEGQRWLWGLTKREAGRAIALACPPLTMRKDYEYPL
jgi:hypothetical protein